MPTFLLHLLQRIAEHCAGRQMDVCKEGNQAQFPDLSLNCLQAVSLLHQQ